jgi:hypothetical protein
MQTASYENTQVIAQPAVAPRGAFSQPPAQPNIGDASEQRVPPAVPQGVFQKRDRA